MHFRRKHGFNKKERITIVWPDNERSLSFLARAQKMKQFTLFDYMDDEKNVHINPIEKNNTDSIIEEILYDVIMTGTGFTDGKKRVFELYQKNVPLNERVQAIKNEYGVGGGSLHGKYFRHGLQNHDGSGIKINYDEQSKSFSWNHVEKIIHSLIDSEKYYVPPKVNGYCHATLNPCNRENLTPVARELGMKCESPCCASCSERKECGADCYYSHNHKR